MNQKQFKEEMREACAPKSAEAAGVDALLREADELAVKADKSLSGCDPECHGRCAVCPGDLKEDMTKCIRDLSAALRRQQEQGVPEEWKLVPIKITRAMEAAGTELLQAAVDASTPDCICRPIAADIFDAMLAAAPQPPSGGSTKDEWTHVCRGKRLTLPAGELCDRCGMEMT